MSFLLYCTCASRMHCWYLYITTHSSMTFLPYLVVGHNVCTYSKPASFPLRIYAQSFLFDQLIVCINLGTLHHNAWVIVPYSTPPKFTLYHHRMHYWINFCLVFPPNHCGVFYHSLPLLLVFLYEQQKINCDSFLHAPCIIKVRRGVKLLEIQSIIKQDSPTGNWTPATRVRDADPNH